MTIKKQISEERTAERFAGYMGVYRVEWDEEKEDWIQMESSIIEEHMRTGPFSGADSVNLPLIDSRYIEIFPDAPYKVAHLDSAISKAILDEPLMVFRGANLEEFRGIETGKEIVYMSPSFTSTTFSLGIAMKHVEQIDSSLIGMQVPAGTGIGILTGDGENQELLLKRASIFRLISYDPDSEGIKAVFRFIG